MYLMVGPSAMELTPSSWLFPDLLPLRVLAGIQQGCGQWSVAQNEPWALTDRSARVRRRSVLS